MFLSQDHYTIAKQMVRSNTLPEEPCGIRNKLNAIDGVIFSGINTTKGCQVKVACTQSGLLELLKILRAVSVSADKIKPKLVCDLYGENTLAFDLCHIGDLEAALMAFEKAIGERHLFSEESHFVDSFVSELGKQLELEKITSGRDMQYVCQPYRKEALSILDALYVHKDLYTCSLVIVDRGEKDDKFRTSLTLLCYPSQEGHAKYIKLYEILRECLRDKALMKLTYSATGTGLLVAITMNMAAHTPWAADYVLNQCMSGLLDIVQKL